MGTHGHASKLCSFSKGLFDDVKVKPAKEGAELAPVGIPLLELTRDVPCTRGIRVRIRRWSDRGRIGLDSVKVVSLVIKEVVTIWWKEFLSSIIPIILSWGVIKYTGVPSMLSSELNMREVIPFPLGKGPEVKPR
jgi:hypothetical protein